MARPGVTEEQVTEAIEALQEFGAKITIENIRAELGHGSPNTINRYLKIWRARPDPAASLESQKEARHLKRKCTALEADLQAQSEQAQMLSQQIVDRDRQILDFEKQFAEQGIALRNAQHEIERLEAMLSSIEVERSQILNTLITEQRAQGEQFREDLKAVNQMSLAQVREISMAAQDRWLEEKIKVRELSAGFEQQKLLNQELSQKILKEQEANQPLRKRIADQEHLISHCLDPKKVEAYQDRKERGE